MENNIKMTGREPQEHTCRLCATDGLNFIPIFQKSEGDVIKMIRCLPVQIRSNDGLPSYICPGCLEALGVSYNLHILCLKANLRLLERSTELRTRRIVEKGRMRVQSVEAKREIKPPKPVEKKPNVIASAKAETGDANDPVIVEAYHFPEALYNEQQDLTKISERISEVKLEKVNDSSSGGSHDEYNRKDLSFINARCKLEPIDIDEPGPSENHTAIFAASKTTNSRARQVAVLRNDFHNPQKMCKQCSRTISVQYFRFLSKRPGHGRRYRADICNFCNVITKPIKIYNPKSRLVNEPCRSVENVPKTEEKALKFENDQDFEKVREIQIPNDHSYARFARSCALKTIWKQQLHGPKASPKPRVSKPKTAPEKKLSDLSSNNYSCVLCGKAHKSQNRLKYHITTQHTLPDQWEYSCKDCGDKFPVIGDLRRHEKWNHNSERRFSCSSCPQVFSSASGLGRHIWYRHTPVKEEQDKHV